MTKISLFEYSEADSSSHRKYQQRSAEQRITPDLSKKKVQLIPVRPTQPNLRLTSARWKRCCGEGRAIAIPGLDISFGSNSIPTGGATGWFSHKGGAV